MCVNDFTLGTKMYWKGKYDFVVSELYVTVKPNRSTWLSVLKSKLRSDIKKKVRSIIYHYIAPHHYLSKNIIPKNNGKTYSVSEILKQDNIVNLYRIAFDKMVLRIKNEEGNASSESIGKLLRHINDYNHTEYLCCFNNKRNKSNWTSKMNWGSVKYQNIMNNICKEIHSIRNKKAKIVLVKRRENENNFVSSEYKLSSEVDIIRVNNKSVCVKVANNEVTKKIIEDKKTKRCYINDPVKKGKRLYADEKYVKCDSKLFSLYSGF